MRVALAGTAEPLIKGRSTLEKVLPNPPTTEHARLDRYQHRKARIYGYIGRLIALVRALD